MNGHEWVIQCDTGSLDYTAQVQVRLTVCGLTCCVQMAPSPGPRPQLELYAKPPSHQNPWVGCNGRASQVWEPCARNRLHPRNRAKRQSPSIPARLSPFNMSLGGTVWGFGLRGRVDRVTVQENIPSMSRAIILPNEQRVHAYIQILELVLNSGGNCRT